MKYRFVFAWCAMLAGITVLGATAPLKLITASSPTLASATGNGESSGDALTPDGRYAVFTSYVANLVTNDSNLDADVFLFDRQAQALSLISANQLATGTGNGNSANGSLSDDGRYVAFESEADDLSDENDDNGCSDIYVRDCLTGTTRLVSLKPESPEAANGPSVDPYLTADGSQVFFQSQASNLVADDANAVPDLFRRDLREPSLLLVSRYQDVPCGMDDSVPYAATPDGRYVLFVSAGSSATVNLSQEVLLRDVSGFSTRWISQYARQFMLQAATNSSFTNLLGYIQYSSLALSPNGRWAVFGVSGRIGNLLFLYDHQGDQTHVVATNSPNNRVAWEPSFSGDSRFFCYVLSHPTRGAVLQLYDTTQHTQRRIGYPVEFGEEVSSQCANPLLDRTANTVVFLGTLGLTGVQHDGAWNVYHQDLATGAFHWLSSYATNRTGFGDSFLLTALSEDGQVALFDGANDRVVPNDQNRCRDVFIRDIREANAELVSALAATATPGSTANGRSALCPGGMSEDGQRILFTSLATTLSPMDANLEYDLYLHDLATSSNSLISVNYLGNGAGNQGVRDPIISRDGRLVVFVSDSTNLMPDDTNGLPDVFLRDTLTQTTECITRVPALTFTSTWVTNYGRVSMPRLSPSGQHVAFCSQDAMPRYYLYLFNRSTHQTTQLSNPLSGFLFSGSIGALEFSADENWLVGWSSRFGWCFRIQLSNTTVEVDYSIKASESPSFSADGRRVAYIATPSRQIEVKDFSMGSILFTPPSSPAWSPTVSRDGRLLVYLTQSAAGASHGFTQVMLADLRTGSTMVVSSNPITGALADGDCRTPLISPDNRRIIFVSKARNLAPETDDHEWNDVLVRDLYTGLIHLVSKTPQGKAGNFGSAGPGLSPDGKVLAFTTSATDFVAQDLNLTSDLFTTHFLEEDSDEDGLPDDWEQAYWGATTAAPQEDPDQDGFTNQQELLLGTNPQAQASCFRLDAVTMPNSFVRLTWVSAPGRTYQVQYTEQLANPIWKDLAAPVMAASNSTWLEDPSPPTGPTRFYRVVLVGSTAP